MLSLNSSGPVLALGAAHLHFEAIMSDDVVQGDPVTVEGSNTTPEQTQQAVISKRALTKGRKAIEKKNSVLKRLKIEYVPIDSIHPNPYNPNRQSEHDFELLLRSIEEDGFDQPVLVTQNNMIVDGEHRWRGYHSLGATEIPIVRVEMSDEQARISTLRHNRARGSHDVQLEADVLRDLQMMGALDWAKDSLMLDDAELNRLLNDIQAPEALAGEDYTEAWIPETIDAENAELIRSGQMSGEGGDGNLNTTAMSIEAVEFQRKREAAVAKAHTEQEKQMIKKDQGLYRVSLIYTEDEAHDVRAVLGNRPAQKLLELCREALNNGHID